MSLITRSQRAVGYTAGSAALASSITSTTFNAIFAASQTNVSGIQLLGFISVGINVLSAASLAFFVFYYIPKINTRPLAWTAGFSWRVLAVGISVSCIGLAASVATLVWTTIRRLDLPKEIVGVPKQNLLISWWAVWAVSFFFDILSFAILFWWTNHRLRANSIDQSSLDFGIPSPAPMEERPTTRDTNRSFRSQDPTLAATPPRTPPAPSSRSSTKSPYSAKVRRSSSRTKLVRQNSTPRESAKSSFDTSATETGSIDDGFDRWDTSGVGREMRRTLQASPPATALETIPGSRPESPAKPLDGPFLPESPHASTTDTTTLAENYNYSATPSINTPNNLSSPPSSPPNFSRPTSRQYNLTPITPPSLAVPPPTPPMEELIHPLFRTNSPIPPPIATPGTSVHASPEAGQTISQLTLTRMRSGSLQSSPQPSPPPSRPDSAGTLTRMRSGSLQSQPSSRASSRPSSAGTLTRMRSGSLPRQSSPLAESESISDHGPGSPGPSIVEEEELPPILPGFVLSAGSRSSLVSYGKRKSVKGRHDSPEV